jgi:hypothetical protein
MVALQERRVSVVTQGRTSRKSPTKRNCNFPAILRAARAVACWMLLGGVGFRRAASDDGDGVACEKRGHGGEVGEQGVSEWW